MYAIPLDRWEKDSLNSFKDAIAQEVRLYQPLFDEDKTQINSLYFGGGTPSLMKPEQLREVIHEINQSIGVCSDQTEISLEASPETLGRNKLLQLRSAGFNRISIGVQTLDSEVLRYVGRLYEPETGIRAVDASLEAGFRNVNVDLIMGLPTQTLKKFSRSLSRVIELSPHTVTLYPLIIRPITRFGQEVSLNLLEGTEPSFLKKLYSQGKSLLENSGYIQESMTRWVFPDEGGYRQQSDEFDMISTLGIGPSARSYTDVRHYSTEYAINTQKVCKLIGDWKRKISMNLFPATQGIKLSLDERKRKYLIFGLLAPKGLDGDTYLKEFGEPICKKFGAELRVLKRLNLIDHKSGGNLAFTPVGEEFSSAICSRTFYSKTVVSRLEDYKHV